LEGQFGAKTLVKYIPIKFYIQTCKKVFGWNVIQKKLLPAQISPCCHNPLDAKAITANTRMHCENRKNVRKFGNHGDGDVGPGDLSNQRDGRGRCHSLCLQTMAPSNVTQQES
jgi:hypothetical protein